MSDSYQERIDRILTTVNHKEPDKVPILSMFGTYAIGYANGTLAEIEKDPRKEIEYFCAPHKDIYSDATLTSGIIADPLTARTVGSESYFASEDGQTIQNKENAPMLDSEYAKLIADPMDFIFNEMLQRKAKKLVGTTEEKHEVLKAMINRVITKGAIATELKEILKNEYNVPVLAGGYAYAAMDIVFDYMRGFKGISLDLRRRKDELEAAINALYDFSNKFMGIDPTSTSVPEFPFYATMMHVPTFLSPKQFDRFFAPTYEKLIKQIYERGGKLIIFLEGEWNNKSEFLNSLPKDFAIGIVEGDDIFEMKKKVGDNITLAGGMPVNLLQFGKKQECIDYAKKVVDECAPGGGYIFTSNRELISKGDVNKENLIAVNNFVHNYGVYK
ncbi:hypothetical protein GC105_16200 [Alkalibaculum sp. M08DMB]|uniref:Uroporphyrinogen decarboxylase (URO-D) domain-containing protein n=1 Tax=Alkalibaculum sporogenes TaxID=2655001 RepID=A0A6A7KCQ9_9FIRM|nr:uroporphyrinogen decarboxylase family protein [Alkalibaculum sporogenes]MPW27308.1 hypothetical protein [Alkalibaculum sporogenes]